MKADTFFNCQWISESRTTLMGWAMISVMVLHSCVFAHISLQAYPLRIVEVVCTPVFTGVFMFLSGYGLYFSLNKDANVMEFYKRRLSRLLIPFLLMVTPFYLFSYLTDKLTIGEFLLSETTLYNFIVSNNGMWYIAASLLMYTLSPFIFRLMGCSAKRSLAIGTIFTIAFIGVSIAIHSLTPDYSLRTSILWDKLAIFIVGMTFGFLTLRTRIGGGKILIPILS